MTSHMLKTLLKLHAVPRRFPHRTIATSSWQHQRPVEFTHLRYPELKRADYARLESKHVTMFENIVGANNVLTATDDVEPYNVDWLRTVKGTSSIVLRPASTEEVAAIMKVCSTENLAVCPQGGNTGLVGGSVPVFDEIVISTALMNEIIHFDSVSGVIVCQAGCILEKLDEYARKQGLMMPLDLGAKSSCHIGGNVATNAGGLRLMRYGSLHNNILGLEIVKADGTILDCLNCLKKDNTGYPLHHLFIGSEGTLGIITKVAIQCPPAPKAVSLAFLGLEDIRHVIQTATAARSAVGEVLSACEMLDAESADAVVKNIGLKYPLNSIYPFYILLETSGSNAVHDEEKLSKFLEEATASSLVQNGTCVTEPSHIKTIWQFRECIAEALLRDGYVYKYDISLPLLQFYGLITEFDRTVKAAGAIRCCGFGHLGDGNIHFNVTAKEFSHNMLKLIEPYVYKWTSKYRGSISAEHGIGLKKRKFLHFSKKPEAIAVMRDVKNIMDPMGILNPYKVLP